MHKNRSSSRLRESSRKKHYTLSEHKNCETTSAQSEDQSRSSQKKYKYSLFAFVFLVSIEIIHAFLLPYIQYIETVVCKSFLNEWQE